jgi:hypothetical protein
MKTRQRSKGQPRLLIVTPRNEEILRTVYEYRFVTAQDITMLLFSKGSLTYVRSVLSELSGGKDHAERNYLYRFQLPTSQAGNREKVYTLGSLGREFLESLGLRVYWYFRPYKTERLSRSHLLHNLLLTRFVVAAQSWSRTQADINIIELRLCYDLVRSIATIQHQEEGSTLSLIPDAWMLFERTDGVRFPILLEIDRGSEHREKYQAQLRTRLEFILSGNYEKVFKTPAVIIAYVTTGQIAAHRETRVKTMAAWTRDVLAELKMESWAGIFRFTSVVFDTLYEQVQELLEAPVWHRPDSPTPVPLFGS